MIEVEVIVSDEVKGIMPVNPQDINDYADFVFESSGISNTEVNIIFIGDKKMTELNETYKKRSGSTDVLSFNLSDDKAEKIEGEVYVSLERAETQSSEYAVPYEEEVVRLVTHGLLHLVGRVHDTEETSRVMFDETEKMVSFLLKKRTK